MAPLAPGIDRDMLMLFTQELTHASGAIIRRYYRSGYTIDTKSDESPVTIADRETELELRRLIQARFPDHGILGEEYGAHQPESPFRWVLDPIDGTKNFISHSYLFGTLIALLYEGRPIFGAVHHPVSDDLLVGDGVGAWLNGKPARVRPCTRIEDAVVLTSDPLAPERLRNGTGFHTLCRRALRFNTWGDCHGYFLVAIGGADLMLDPVMSVWDLMALIPVVQGAGGRITDWEGNDPVAGSSAIASAGAIHDDVLRLLNG
jgi:histidinol phosphatase-like enzyme (inositol monophosphatase family)